MKAVQCLVTGSSVVLALGMSSCGMVKKDKSSGSPVQPSNTLSPEQFHAKTDTGKEIFRSMKSVRSKFGASSSGMFELFDAAGLAVGEDQGENPQTSGQIDPKDYVPSTAEVTDCASAFGMFESLFKKSEEDYNALATALKNPSAESDGMKIVKVAPAADETVAYMGTPAEGSAGITGKVRMAGGGTETRLLLRQELEMTIDFSKIQQNGPQTGDQIPTMPGMDFDLGLTTMKVASSVDVDLNARVVTNTMNVLSSQKSKTQEDTQAASGVVKVSDGPEKFVSQALKITTTGASKVTLSTDLIAKLVDANTLLITGDFSGTNAPGKIAVKVVRESSGRCSVAK